MTPDDLRSLPPGTALRYIGNAGVVTVTLRRITRNGKGFVMSERGDLRLVCAEGLERVEPGRDVGIERDPEFCEIARQRIEAARAQLRLGLERERATIPEMEQIAPST